MKISIGKLALLLYFRFLARSATWIAVSFLIRKDFKYDPMRLQLTLVPLLVIGLGLTHCFAAEGTNLRERSLWTAGDIDCPEGYFWLSIYVGSGEVSDTACSDVWDDPDVQVTVTVNGQSQTTDRDDK